MDYRRLLLLLIVLLSALVSACSGGSSNDTAPPVDNSGGSGSSAAPGASGGSGSGSSAAPGATGASTPFGLTLQPVVSGLNFPVFLSAPPGDPRQFVVERGGRIRIIANGALLPAPFLDISASTTTDGERGLLSLAFAPNYASTGYFFIYHTDLSGNIVIERVRVSATNPNLADPLSRLTILTIAHPGFSNHNGGLLSFGSDGFLYLGVGDGGSGGDPPGNAQNTNVLLGKLLRIDVSQASAAQPYTIPADNPFAGQSGKRGEIWAYGLRNPWRYAFDSVQQRLYIADVGQAQREEVDAVSAQQGGINYGWNSMEGRQCYNASSCQQTGLTLPVLDYGHGASAGTGCSIVGGYVYRGTALPELAGRYLYSDYCGGWLKSFLDTQGTVSEATDWGITPLSSVTSFGQDGQNELYIMSANGGLYRIVRK